MNMKVAVVVGIIIVVIVGAVLFFTSSSSTSTRQTTQTAQPSANAVAIQNFAFSPSSITVKKGTSVTWTNQDSAGHTVTKDSGQSDGPDSQTLNQGQSYSFTFNTPGTYTYHCSIHPNMTGTVVVQ